MEHAINSCKICGSVNMTSFKNISNYNVCYYCYTVKNNNATSPSNIENPFFESLLDNSGFDISNRSNIVSINYENKKEASFSVTNYDIYDDDYSQLNSSLKFGKIDTLLVPNIENIDFTQFIQKASTYMSPNIQIFAGFFTSIKHFKDLNMLDKIKYIYNAYAISKVLSQNNLKLYIHNFWEENNYLLLQINKAHNLRTEKDLQRSFDQMFYSNFKQEVNL